MNYIQNYLAAKNIQQPIPSKGQTQKNNQPVPKDLAQTSQPLEVQAISPDYNVRVPISYTRLEDIKINEELSARQYKLANGQRVVILPKDGPTVVKTYVNTGSFNEPDNLRGISHYIEHNLFNGSEDLQDKVFFDEVNKIGAQTNAYTSFSETSYFINSNLLEDSDLETSIQLHAGMLSSPKFLLDKLEKEKKIVNSEINMYMAEDENLGFSQTIKNLFNIKSSSPDLVAGSTDNITKLTRDDVVNYYNNNYYPANMTTVITGEVEPDETMKLVSKYFNTKNKVSSPRHFEKMTPIEKSVRQDIISKKSQGEAAIFLGFAGPKNNDFREKTILSAMMILANRLANSKTAETKRKYAANIDFDTERLSSRPDDNNMIMLTSKIPDANVEMFLKEIYSIIDKLGKVPPTEDELSAIKNYLKKSDQKSNERSSALNFELGHACLNSIEDQIQNFDKIVESITPEDITNIAKKYLDLNKAALTVVHPSNTNEKEINENYEKAASISFTGLNKKAPLNINNTSIYKLPNNFEIILNDTKSNTAEYRLEIANRDMTPKSAVAAAVLNNMLKNTGTPTLSVKDFSKKADIIGLSAAIHANNNEFTASANVPAENLENSLEIIHDKILNPNLTQEVFEKSVSRLKSIYASQDVNAWKDFNKSIYKDTPLQFDDKDKLKALETLTLDDVKECYNNLLRNSQGQIVVSAPFSKHPELKQKIFNAAGKFSKMKPVDTTLPKIFKPTEATEVHTTETKKNQAEIIEGFKFKNTGNMKDKVALDLLNEILGGSSSSRLFSDLREKQHLAYATQSSIGRYCDMGVMFLDIGTTTENLETGEKTFDNLQKSIEGFNANIKKIMTEKVTPEELEMAKKALKSEILSAMETNSVKTNMLIDGKNTPYGIDYINKLVETIDTITQDDILNCANYVFKNKPVYSIAATKDTLDANKEFLENLKKS